MYNKIFTKILDSSIWLESHATVRVWITFIAAMDEDGFASFASVANVAHRARVSRDEAIDALKALEGPDDDSSDPSYGGRRLERVAGGWVVLNAEKYREIVRREEMRRKTRDRVAKHRAKKRESNGLEGGNNTVSVTNDRSNVTGNAEAAQGNGSVMQSDTDAIAGTEASTAVQTETEDQREVRADSSDLEGEKSRPGLHVGLQDFESVREHLKAAAYAFLAEFPEAGDVELTEAVKDAAGKLRVWDYSGTRIDSVVRQVRGYLAQLAKGARPEPESGGES